MAKKTATKKPAPKASATQFAGVQNLFKPFESAMPNLNVEQASRQAREQMEKLGFSFFQQPEELAQLGKDNVEAIVKSSQILAKTAEDMSRMMTTFTQESMELTAKAGQAMLGAKTLQDCAEVQAELAKSALEHCIANAAKFSDMAMKVANQAAEPIAARVNVAVEKMTKAA